MFAFVEGYPNTAIIIFYVLASEIFAATLYHHHKQV
jgi:hypothetical protein